MLTAPPRPEPEPAAAPGSSAAVSFALSSGAHLAALAFLLLPPAGRSMPPSPPPIEIEMIEQQAQQTGAPQPPPQAQATANSGDAAAASASSPSPPAFAAPQVPAPAPAPAEKRDAAAPAAKPAPEVNLGNALDDRDPLSVTGDNVVPPKPDARYHNLPPRYPAAAARIGAEGVVQIVAHVLPNGFPASVDIAGSSGNPDLDEEARRAVLLWRFTPARDGGRAVPFDYVVDIRFALGSR